MKNIQVIDGARNCTYSIYAVTNEDFDKIFPLGQDIEFSTDLFERINESELSDLLARLWERKVDKKQVNGIHGTLFYELDEKKILYPTKKEKEMLTGQKLMELGK